MRKFLAISVIIYTVLAAPVLAGTKGLTVTGVRYSTYRAFTRIVFDVDTAAPYVLLRSPDGRSVLLSAYEGSFIVKASLPAVRDGVVAGIEKREGDGRTSIVIRLDEIAGELKDFTLHSPDRIVIDLARGASAAPRQGGGPVLIVLDPGHGGRDMGLATSQGLEKTFTLELANAVRTLLQKDGRYRVVLTREKDQLLSLEERSATANASGAALFISLHAANGAGDRVYIGDISDEEASQSDGRRGDDFLGFEAGNEQRESRWGAQQAAHAKESSVLGRLMAKQLAGDGGAEPEQSPLSVLQTADAAAILVEIGADQDLQRAAEGIAAGIDRYVGENK
jgi:N-acetylmuramoyl-L-alanine amidase